MNIRCSLIAATLTASLLAACGGGNSGLSSPAQPLRGTSMGRGGIGVVPRYITVKPHGIDYAKLAAQARAGETIPFWTGSIQSPLDGRTYSYSIVGKNPAVAPAEETVVKFVPIVVIMKFPEGTLDPTQSGCNDDLSVEDRFFKGPDFEKTHLDSNGVDLGTVEIDDAFQRAEFWKILAGPDYHLVLKPAVDPIVLTKDAPADSYTFDGVCSGSHFVGVVDWTRYDEMVKDLAEKYAKPNEIPLVLTYNVVMSSAGSCCVLGWHSSFARKDGTGTQVYAAAVYNDDGTFYEYPGVGDIHAWTHEIGEIFNNPFGQNVTPPWGHTGQVFGWCQADLEVGDPTTFDWFDHTYNGFQYHPQELAFFSWFYRTASIGTGGSYSFKGTFSSPQGTCS